MSKTLGEKLPLLISADQPVKKPRCHYCLEVLTALVACLYTLDFGLVLGFTSPAIPYLQDEGILLTDADISWFGSLSMLGSIAAGLVGGYLMDAIGRKVSILLTGIPYAVGWSLLAFGDTLAIVFVGRVLTGLAVGLCSMAVPTYVAEISSKEIRGSLGAVTQVTIPAGMCIMYTTGIVLKRKQLALLGFITSIVAFLCLIPFPESPKWLLKKGKSERARKSLQWLRGKGVNISHEIVEFYETVLDKSTTSLQFSEFLQKRNLKPLGLAVLIKLFMLLPGCNAVAFYMEPVLIKARLSPKDINLYLILVGFLPIGAILPAILFLDRFGRKFFLFSSSILMTLSLTALGVSFYWIEVKQDLSINWLVGVASCGYQIGFNLGWAPVAWIVVSEILPVRVRAFGMAMVTTLNWSIGFLIAKTFPAMSVAIGMSWSYWLYGSVAFLGIGFVIFVLPETKGKSLEEIEAMFGKDEKE